MTAIAKRAQMSEALPDSEPRRRGPTACDAYRSADIVPRWAC